MDEIRLTSWYGEQLPSFTGVSYISYMATGAGFLPSTICPFQESHPRRFFVAFRWLVIFFKVMKLTYVARIKHCKFIAHVYIPVYIRYHAYIIFLYIHTWCKQLHLTLLSDLPTSRRFWIDNIMIPIIPAIQLVVSWGAMFCRRESAVRDLLLREFKLTPIIRMNDKEVKDKPRSNETGSKKKRSWNRCEQNREGFFSLPIATHRGKCWF